MDKLADYQMIKVIYFNRPTTFFLVFNKLADFYL